LLFNFLNSIKFQTEEGSNSCSDPLFVTLYCGDVSHHDKVGRLARGAESALAGQSLVDRAHLHVGFLLHILLGFEPEDRHFGLEFSRTAVDDHAVLEVVAGALQVDAAHLAAVWSLLLDVFSLHECVDPLEGEVHKVYGDFVLARLVLLGASQEGLREEEAAHPEAVGRAVRLPVAHEFHACDQVAQPVAQRLDREEPAALLLRPAKWHFVIHHFDAQHLQLLVHHDAPPVGIHKV